MADAIVVNDLSYWYEPSFPVIRNASFRIPTGSLVAIVGPNGGGKTTLLRLLLGFLQPKSGSITLSDPAISYVPQRLHFNTSFPLSVLDLVLMGSLARLTWYGMYPIAEKKKALALLQQVGIAEYANKPVSILSGGQFQRALIARALLSNPKILLLDEPTAGIDPTAQKEIITLLSHLKGQVTLLLVTHHLEAVATHADAIITVNLTLQMQSC